MIQDIYKDVTISGETDDELRQLREIVDYLDTDAIAALSSAELREDHCELQWSKAIPKKCDFVGFEMPFSDGTKYIHVEHKVTKES